MAAIVAANSIVARFGPVASVICAFVFIGLDITTRDYLHDSWRGKMLFPKMAALIVSGSILSAMVNAESGRIALASAVSFFAAGSIDAIVYHALKRVDKFKRVFTSNLFSGALDSYLFPVLAFGEYMPLIFLGQFIAKIFGGYLWFLIISRKRENPHING